MGQFFNQVILTYQDINGQTAENFLATQDQSSTVAAAYEALVTAIEACTDAKIVCLQFQGTLNRDVTPEEGPYCTAYDRGVLFSKNSVSQKQQRLALVGPKEEIFDDDTYTIDLENTNIIALQAQWQAFCGDGSGNPAGPFLRGSRQEA